MREKDVISVIVPVYNVEKYLERCVESIIKQTYDKLQILLVDDASKDRGGTSATVWHNRTIEYM